MALVCLDTHILIWGVQKTSRQPQSEMILQTTKLLKYLDDHQIKAIIPAVVLSEFLMAIPAPHLETYLTQMTKKFLIAPYDAMAAVEFAKIWQAKQAAHTIQSLKNEEFSKSHLKVDTMIIATALTQNASCIYSHDPGLKKFASGYIEVREVPSNL